MQRRWHPVNPQQPCRICRKPDWCSRSTDGEWIACRRLNTGAGLHRLDKAGVEYWLYPPENILHTEPSSMDIPLCTVPERADSDTLYQVYRTLLAMLPLSPVHREKLRRRGLSDDEITRRRYRTLPGQGRAELARRLIDRFGPEICARVPGLYIREGNGRRWWSLAGAPGLLIPVRDVAGRIIALIVRSDNPDAEPRYSAVSSKSHGGPGSGTHVHIPLSNVLLLDIVRVTEGPLKADIATALSGILTVGLPGAGSWRQGLPVLEALQPETVVLAFDADARQQEAVASALQGATRALQGAGFSVRLELWPASQGKGIDDVLAAGHNPEMVVGRDVQQAIQGIVCAAYLAQPQPEVCPTRRRPARGDWQMTRALTRQREAEATARRLLARRREA